MEKDKATRKEFLKTKVLAVVTLVCAPISYYLIASQILSEGQTQGAAGGHVDMMFYILILISLVSPTVLPLVERAQVSKYRSDASSNASPAQLMTTFYITKFAFIEATFLYGMIIFFMTRDIERMLIFYPIAILWSVIYWPRKKKMLQTLERLETL